MGSKKKRRKLAQQASILDVLFFPRTDMDMAQKYKKIKSKNLESVKTGRTYIPDIKFNVQYPYNDTVLHIECMGLIDFNILSRSL